MSDASSTVQAAAAKEHIQLSGSTTYYGEVKDGVPHGKGTIKWSSSKQYSGDFVNGKREGTGKYINEYVSEGERHKVVYSGSWKQDQMNGEGKLTEKVTQEDGTVRWHELQTGTFKNGKLQKGYEVIQALADPDFSYKYKSPQETLYILGSGADLRKELKKGYLYYAEYTKGSTKKTYSVIPSDTKAEQRQNEAALKYLQSIQSKLDPHLRQFYILSKQVPLK